jgi:hypothetical protein
MFHISIHDDGSLVKLDNVPITRASFVKDLPSVLIDDQLTFDNRLRIIVSRTYRRANLILECFCFGACFYRICSTCIRVRYVRSDNWPPHLLKDIKLVESVQKRFAKRQLWKKVKNLGPWIAAATVCVFSKFKIESKLFSLNLNTTTRENPCKLFLSLLLQQRWT